MQMFEWHIDVSVRFAAVMAGLWRVRSYPSWSSC